MSQPQSALELLQTLIRTASVSPDGEPGVGEAQQNEEACAKVIGAFLESAGATVEYQTVMPLRPNVLGRFPTDRPGKPRVIFAPHTDTVSVGGMTIDPFSGEVRDGRVWGRGATDTKGPSAAMLWALWEKREEIAALDHEIWFVSFMGEEGSQHGSRAFVPAYCADAPEKIFALVGEPTGDSIVHAHKGSCRLTLTCRGVAVHSSTPERGENAIVKMVNVLQRFEQQVGPALLKAENAVLGRPTYSIGLIKGGTRTNIVPDHCEASIDIRTTPELHRIGGEQGLVDWIMEQLREVDPALECDSREVVPLWTDVDHPLIAALQQCGTRRKTPGGAPWYCDAAVFSAGGVPAVAAGPGGIAQAHTKDEHITLEDFEEGIRFYRDFLNQL